MKNLRWVGTGAWAVIDQGLFAGSNFVLNLFLARWMGPEGYGVFSVAFAIFLFAALAFTALIIEPLMVFGTEFRSTFRVYLKRLSLGYLALSLASALVLLLVALAVRWLPEGTALSQSLLAASWAGPLITLTWVIRRITYVVEQPRIAASGGVVYLVTLLGVVISVNHFHIMNNQWAFGAMAIASVVSSLYLLWQLDAIIPEGGAPDVSRSVSDILGTHWRFGRWLLAGAVLGWVASDMMYLLLTPTLGYNAAGILRAANNLLLPIKHTQVALAAIAIPWLVRELATQHRKRLVLNWWLGLTGLSAVYTVVLIVFRSPIISVVYGDAFGDLGAVLVIIALTPLVGATGTALAAVLKAQLRTRALFITSLVSALTILTFGLALIRSYGLLGAATALVLSSVFTSLAFVLLLWRTPPANQGSLAP